MLPRIILVGLVSALGLSAPTRPEVIGCVKALHSWMAGQFAALDGCGRGEDQQMALATVALADAGPYGSPTVREAPLVDRVPVPEREHPKVAPPIPSFTPIAVEEQVAGLAHDLNRQSEGLGIRELPSTPRRLPIVRTTSTEQVVPSPRIARAFLEIAMIEEMLATSREESSASVVPVEAPVVSAKRRARWAEAGLECILGSMMATQPGHGVPAVATTVPLKRILPVEEDGLSLAVQLNRFGEAVDPVRPAERVGPTAPAGIATIVPVAASDTGIAEELNRAAEGLGLARVGEIGDAPAGREVGVHRAPTGRASVGGGQAAAEETSGLGDALRLTREAARAWMNVLRPAGGDSTAAEDEEVQVERPMSGLSCTPKSPG